MSKPDTSREAPKIRAATGYAVPRWVENLTEDKWDPRWGQHPGPRWRNLVVYEHPQTINGRRVRIVEDTPEGIEAIRAERYSVNAANRLDAPAVEDWSSYEEGYEHGYAHALRELGLTGGQDAG